ncbi:tyrosine-type recombinase/integrase [Entomobacter blattae]|uniref:Tyrosine recombinase XerC n=1 Tax=Entomobacter blattae TaxID=2762277 RepID=A0A7H1NUG2_9PROT|nr:tyrosine-type recombinase/integrase [Entomobacter blattae]QNT79422.1 Tyrosine recombinase XerC [Entomobacter blattae]
MSDNSFLGAEKFLLKMWLHNRAEHTRRAYTHDVRDFLQWVQKPLGEIVLSDLQGWFDILQGSEATRRRKVASVKSLLHFAHEQGVLASDPGYGFRLKKSPDALHERIITQEEALKLIREEKEPRKHALLRLLYVMGLRISEACSLTWKDMVKNRQGGTMNIYGKGGKMRQIGVPKDLWGELEQLRDDSSPTAPVIPGRDGKTIQLKAAHRIVKRAAKRVGLPDEFSAHWLRHACASHAQDNGAPPHVVQHQLGHASLATTTRYTHARAGDSASSYLKG